MKQTTARTDPKMKELAKILRKNSSLGEIMLWKELRGKQMLGYEFQRQKPLGKYIVDFYCAALRLAIEIDPYNTGCLNGGFRPYVARATIIAIDTTTSCPVEIPPRIPPA